MGIPPTGQRRRRIYADPQPPISDDPLGPLISATPPAAASSPGFPGGRGPPQEPSPQTPVSAASTGPPGRCRPPQELSPQPWISASPAATDAASRGPTISNTPAAADAAASLAPPGRRGPPQEPRHRPPISATSAFDPVVRQNPPACHRPPQEPSPQPPISATPAVAATSPGPLGLWPPRNLIPQTPRVASDPLIVVIEDWKDCHLLWSPGSAKIVAVISKKFPIHELPILEATIARELLKPLELWNFVVANPEITYELRQRQAIDARNWVQRRARLFAFPGPPGPLGPHQEPKPGPRISSSPDPPARHRPPQEPSTQPPISATPAVAAFSSSSPLGPRPTVLINNLGNLHAPTSPFIAIISWQFPPRDLALLEARIVTELKKPQELRSFAVANPEIISELRKQRGLLLTTVALLDSMMAQNRMLVHELVEIKCEIVSVGRCIPVEGIDQQITLVANAVTSLSLQRQSLLQQYGI